MKRGAWNASFTIVLDGKEIDITELSSISLMQILLQVRKGVTSGELYEEETRERAAS